MAPIVLSNDEKQAAMDAASSELKFLLGKEGIQLGTQARLFHCGATTLSKFGAFFADEKDLREVAKEELGIDAAASLRDRAELAGLIVCYNQAKTRTAEVSKFIGELDARQQAKPIIGTEFLAMRTAFEQKYEKLDDQDCPSRLYLERRVAELESGEMRAEQLKTVLNREQDGEEALIPTWDSGGTLKLRKSVSDIDEPSNPEELRRRLGVMFTGLCSIALQHTNRGELQSLTPQFVHTYCSYLLGEHVYQFIAKDEQGLTVASPCWGLVLSYEFAIRKRAYRRMAETQRSFVDLMKESMLDPVTKERFFTTPLAISTAAGGKRIEVTTEKKRNASDMENGYYREEGGRGRTKGKGRGGRGRGGGSNNSRGHGSKSRGKTGDKPQMPKGCAAKTPDGKPICYGYNCPSTRCRKKDCTFVHVCGLCFGRHPMYACDGKKKWQPSAPAGETQGSG